MIVKVDALNSYDKGVIDWLHRIPQEVQYNPTTKGVTYKGVFYPNVKKHNGIGFIIEDENDPLFSEFKNKFPNTKYEII